ncbi:MULTISPECIES: N-6 DNA methylase [Pasteurella]|uniref:N-6 DNA Methylase n=1 Tax=Pasteurella dagmatis ATCC 43325 TaxID=667128 RepID=C9PRT2_9PAST|nr:MULTISPECIES: N-6 DNA methylase [Pasteurella]EEX49659.1 N-6 DNA Methylase [Pasteurella dagmatis ATCC 43325]GJJ81137.1 restriction endonuclease subunit M [Pasteurella canis]SNV69460.1 putative type I restriction-modification system methyltransferase subunit [Pasteurella dagmatis]
MANSPVFRTIPEGKIADFITGQFRPDTPEEYVRQNIEKRLVNELKYPKDRIGVEVTLQVGSRKPRADVVIYTKDLPQTQENIQIIVECKKENVSSNDKKDGIEQLKSYMTVCPNCEWGLWTNKKERKVLRKIFNQQTQQYEFIAFNDIPDVTGNTDDIDRPKRNKLARADGDNLFLAFRRCHESIHLYDGFNKENAFFEFLKIIFCKIRDERNIPKPLEFYVSSTEKGNLDGQNACKERINNIFAGVKRQFSQIFEANDEIKLSSRSLVEIVSELQGYSFLATDVDLKGRAYEEIVGSNLKGDRGQFFTPRNVMHMAVKMINPKLDEKILDPACGTGGFLVTAMNMVIEQLKQDWAKDLGADEHQWGDDEKKALQQRISEAAASSFFGFDIAPELVKATKMNMVMNNDGSGNILRNDSLLPPHLWESDFKENLAKALGISASQFKSHQDIGLFDVIITNPPFGSKITIQQEYMLNQYEIGHGWENPKKKGGTEWLKKSVTSAAPPEQLFVERCLQLLKPAGRMAIVLPDNILGAPGLGYIRQWLLKEAKIIASVDLDSNTFQPHTGVQTSILILQKKTEAEKKADLEGKMQPYNIFMAVVDKVGHDKRGVNTYLRDENGDEILQEVEESSADVSGEKTKRFDKIPDDQTLAVPEVFARWKKEEGIEW